MYIFLSSFRSHGPPNSLLFPLGQFTSLDQMGIYYICTFQSRRPSVPPSGLFPLHVAVFSSLLYGMKIFITIPPLVGRLLLLFRRRLIRTFNQPNRKKKTKCTPYFSFVFYFIFLGCCRDRGESSTSVLKPSSTGDVNYNLSSQRGIGGALHFSFDR